VDTLPIVSGVRNNVVNTRTTVSDIHRNTLKTHGDKDGHNRAVSPTCTSPATEQPLSYCIDSRQVSDTDYKWIHCLILAFSAPGSLPPPLDLHGTSPDVRHDVKTRAIVSDVHREVADTHVIVSDIRREMLKSQEGAGSQHRSVSVTRTPPPNVHLALHRLKICQQSRSLLSPASNVSI